MARREQRSAVLCIALATLCVAAPPALAHAIGFSCKLMGNLVRVEAYFSDDTPAINALIVVRNEQNEIVAHGRTDDRGVWAFSRPAPARYEVSIDGGAGHRAAQRLTIPEQPSQPGSQEAVVSDGPVRDDFTRVPWLRLGIGLTVILLLAMGWLGRTRLPLRPNSN